MTESGRLHKRCPQLIEAVGDSDLRRRRRAMTSLSSKTHLSCIERGLRDPAVPAATKRLLCEVLYRQQWRETAPALIDQVLHSTDPRVRGVAAEALAGIGDVASGPILLKLLNEEGQPASLRSTVAYALGSLRYHPASTNLADLLGDEEPKVRAVAAASLAALAEPATAPILEAAQSAETDQWVAERLATALRIVRERRDLDAKLHLAGCPPGPDAEGAISTLYDLVDLARILIRVMDQLLEEPEGASRRLLLRDVNNHLFQMGQILAVCLDRLARLSEQWPERAPRRRAARPTPAGGGGP